MRFDEIADLNPACALKRGVEAPFIDMASLPTMARDVAVTTTRPFKGSGSRFQNGDTLIARITPCLENGKGALVLSLPKGAFGHGSTEFIVARAKRTTDAEFVYYLTRNSEFRSTAISRMEGTSGRQRVSWQQIARIEIPDLHWQDREKVGRILGVLDDKIELNRRMSATLEEMVRALYRSWFVDFDPVQARALGQPPAHMDAATAALFPDSFGPDGLPKGWEVGTLGNLIDFNPKESLQKGTPAPYLEMKALPTAGMSPEPPYFRAFTSGTKFRELDTLLARITPCLENGKTALVDDLLDAEVGWGSTEFIVMRAKSGISAAVPYCVARDPDFRAQAIQTMTGSSGRQRADAKRISELEAAIAPMEVYATFAEFVFPMLNRMIGAGKEVRTLAALRDTLLPRLMSGELRIREAEKQVQEVV